jgi:nucleoside-diphosphate-sugar epimerase
MVLITGATGLVGSHVLVELLKQGQPVKALKRSGSNTQLIDDLLAFYGVSANHNLQWVEGNVLDYYSLEDALQGVKQVYHAAAMVSFDPKDAKHMREVNEEGTANLVNACLELGIEKFCFVSSIATLGKNNGHLIDETTFWQSDDTHSNYSKSKFRAEMEVVRASKEGLKTIIVNPSVVIGPGESDRSTGRLFSAIQDGLSHYTSGSTGYVSVRDVASAMVQLMASPLSNERYVLNGQNCSYKDFIHTVSEHCKIPAPKHSAGKVLLSIAWRWEYLKSLITGKAPRITKASARIARSHSAYSSEKIINALNFQFSPISKAVTDTVAFNSCK